VRSLFSAFRKTQFYEKDISYQPTHLFTQIEKDKTEMINVEGKSLMLISEHPESSYQIKEDKEGSVLTITNKKDFWKMGNYLVIQTD
jgi:hypothetical protein